MQSYAHFLVRLPFAILALGIATVGLMYVSAIPDVQMRLASVSIE